MSPFHLLGAVHKLFHQNISIILVKFSIFFPKKLLFRKKVALNMLIKTNAEKKVGVWLMRIWLTKGAGGVREMLTLADKGVRGVWTPKFLLI